MTTHSHSPASDAALDCGMLTAQGLADHDLGHWADLCDALDELDQVDEQTWQDLCHRVEAQLAAALLHRP